MVYTPISVMECLALALLSLMVQSEAPHEPLEGKIAVAYVALNRADLAIQQGTKHFEEVLHAILTQPKQFKINIRLNVSEASYYAARVAFYRLHPDPTNGADHFYNPSIRPWPSWYDERYKTVTIGHHVFLRLEGF